MLLDHEGRALAVEMLSAARVVHNTQAATREWDQSWTEAMPVMLQIMEGRESQQAGGPADSRQGSKAEESQPRRASPDDSQGKGQDGEGEYEFSQWEERARPPPACAGCQGQGCTLLRVCCVGQILLLLLQIACLASQPLSAWY